MTSGDADLRSYYEAEARLRTRSAPHGVRTEWRSDFIARLVAERRTSIVDFGAGPGFDAEPFVAAGFRYVGLDLAHGNAVAAGERRIDVVPGSMASPPSRAGAFDAGWSMSVLMHLPANEVAAVLGAMAAVLVPGSPMFVGLWGGAQRDEIDEAQIVGERRLFSLRSVEHNRELLSTCGVVESAIVVDVGPDDWNYQGFLVRM